MPTTLRTDRSLRIVTLAERPELEDAIDEAGAGVWPEFNRHGDVMNRYWGRLFDEFRGTQFCLLGRTGEVMAVGHALPLAWDGSLKDLPAGIDAAIRRGAEGASAGVAATVLCAMAAIVPAENQGQGLSKRVVQAMAQLGSAMGLEALIAPVRPNLKHRYPLAPIGRYAAWTRADGLPFDPWIRVHARLGGEVLQPAPRSLRITAPVERWEAWTGMAFPVSGRHVFPQGLAPLSVDRERDVGRYFEPNVWMLHRW